MGRSAAKLLFQVVVLVMTTGATAAGAVGAARSSLTVSGPGTVRLTLARSAVAVSGFSMDSGNLVPGSRVEGVLELTNRGEHDLAQVSLTTTAAPSSLLDSHPVHGLQLALDRCPRRWETSPSAPGAYVCTGGALPLIASRPVAVAGLPLTKLAARAPGGTDYLRVTLTLPLSAGNEFQGLTSGIHFSFTPTRTSAG